MHFRVFQYPIPAPTELSELNAWLSHHRIVQVTHHIIPLLFYSEILAEGHFVAEQGGPCGSGSRPVPQRANAAPAKMPTVPKECVL